MSDTAPIWNFARIWTELADVVPDRPAIVMGDRTTTYAAFSERAHRLAAWLLDHGAAAGDAVALHCPNRPEYLEAFFAALLIGARPTNVNYRYVATEVAQVVRDADARVILSGAEQGEIARAAVALVSPPPLVLEVGAAYEAALAEHAVRALPHTCTGDDLIYLYTGGTTGHPKGVMWRNEDLYLALWTSMRGTKAPTDPVYAIRNGLRAATTLPACPLMHGTGLFGTLAALAGGGTIVLVDTPKVDPVAIWDACAHNAVQSLLIVGDAFARPLVDALNDHPQRWDLSALRAIVSSGVTWSPQVKTALLDHLPHIRCIDSLGSSEGLLTRTESAVGAAIIPAAFAVTPHLRVLRDDNTEASIGEVGRLAVAGNVPVGYRNDPEASASAFPTIDGVRYAVPGDLARRNADATVTLLGRGSACINTGGEKVFPEEVELVLRAHPEVLDAVVVGVPDARLGELVSAVIATHDASVPASLDEWCRDHLAAYKVPRRYVARPDLERSAAGKVNLAQLRELAAQSAHEPPADPSTLP
ncbi:MAG: AMP-binding protein [Acidimicrobiia bacterium]